MIKQKNMLSNEGGAVGIGTLIIFIAMVLVAAVAASVLISTAGTLQQKAQTTGKETIAEVSSNLKVESIVGSRNSSTAVNLDWINVTVSTSAGAGNIDLNQTVIKLSNGLSSVDDLVYDSANASSTAFSVTKLRDADSSFTSSTPVINSGDLVIIQLRVDSSGMNMAFPVRKPLKLEVHTESGSPVMIDLVTPSSYGVDTIISLYP